MSKLKISFIISIAGLLCGCSSIRDAHTSKKQMIDYAVMNDQAAVSNYLLEERQSGLNTGDELMWQLECGSWFFEQGSDREALLAFEKAELLIEDYDKRAVVSLRDSSNEISMSVTNLNALPYQGWSRDRIMIPVFKSLIYLGQGDEDGFGVELRRLRNTQDKVAEIYKTQIEAEAASVEAVRKENNRQSNSVKLDDKNFSSDALSAKINSNEMLKAVKEKAHKGYGNFMNPFAVYLSGIGFLRENDYENALVDFGRLYKAMPENSFVQQMYATVLKYAGRTVPEELKDVKTLNYPLNRNMIYVVMANGRSSALKQEIIHLVLPYVGYTGLAWPVCEYYNADFQGFAATYDKQRHSGVKIADMDAILSQEYDERLPSMLTRIVISYMVKEAASLVVTETARASDDTLTMVLAYLGTGVYKYLFNTADTRGWELLPKEYLVMQFPMSSARDLQLELLPSLQKVDLKFSEQCRSAIVYINAFSKNSVKIRVFEFKSK